MTIIDFAHTHVPEALQLVRQDYETERRAVPALPTLSALPSMPDLARFAENGMGVAALEDGRLTGFLCIYAPFENAFGTTDVKAAWSPLHGHAATGDRGKLYQRMYQAAAEKWVRAGAVSHSVTLYAHDQAANAALFQYGFGLRCMDTVCTLDHDYPIQSQAHLFTELSQADAGDTKELRNLLISHLGASPCFLQYAQTNEQDARNIVAHRDSRVFIAREADRIIGYIEMMKSGENFACDAPDMMNLCGACLRPEYRGTGIFTDLLHFVMNTLRTEGYARLGVDFESFNPTARGFWLKHFTAYTHSVVRRIDELGNV